MNTKKVKSLRKKLIFRVILIATVLLLVAVISSQLSSNAAFWKATEESIAKSTTIEIRNISNFFTEAEALLKNTANSIKFVSYTEAQVIEGFLKNARTPYPYVSEIYMGIAETNQYADGAGYVPPPEWVLTKRPYYIGAMNTDGIFYQDPYLASTGEIFSSLAVKLKDMKGAVIGVTVLDLTVETLLDICSKANIQGTKATAFLLDSNKRILAHQNNAFMPHVKGNEAVYVSYDSIGIQEKNTILAGSGNEPKLIRAIDHDGVEKYISSAVLPGSGWTFGFAVPVNDFAANLNTASSMAIYIIIISVAVIAIFFASQFLLIKPIKPISSIMETASLLAVGKTPSPLKIVTNDDLGVLADDFNKFIISTQEQVSVLSQMADGDLTSKVTPKSHEDLLSNAINRMAENIQELIGSIHGASLNATTNAKQLASTAESIASGAAQIACGVQSLAEGATNQTKYMDELSNSVTDEAEKTKANAGMANQAAKLADTIINKAERGNRQMDEMITAVNDITEASKSVSNIMQTINGIAAQTNLLSLNAAIEAARAGEHGKGFSVVAEEVRNLATQSAAAAKETSSIVQVSIEKAELGTRIVKEMAERLTEIISGINESSQLIMEIVKASEEQTKSITQINANVTQVADITQNSSAVVKESAATAKGSAAAAEKSAAAAVEMSRQADTLEQLISRFKLE